jgi:hypothetical protein
MILSSLLVSMVVSLAKRIYFLLEILRLTARRGRKK